MISVGHGALLPLPYSQGRLACSSSNGQTFSSSPKTKLSETGHKKHMARGTYLIIVTDATDAVSVNFSGRCKFLLILLILVLTAAIKFHIEIHPPLIILYEI